jgi:SSS family solute:Na+ symporter
MPHTDAVRIIADRDAIFPTLLASLVCLVTVSLLTPPPTESHLRALAEDAHAS